MKDISPKTSKTGPTTGTPQALGEPEHVIPWELMPMYSGGGFQTVHGSNENSRPILASSGMSLCQKLKHLPEL